MLNSKFLKKLRSMVRKSMTQATPRYLYSTPNVRWIPGPQVNQDGTPQMIPFEYTGTLRNHPHTQRAVYRKAKRLAVTGV